MIYNKYFEGGTDSKMAIMLEEIKNKCSFKNLLFVVLSFIMVYVASVGEFSPFSYILFGVASVFNVPLILVFLSAMLGMVIQGFTAVIVLKLVAFFALFTLITAFINIEGISRRYSVYIKFIISYLIVDVISIIMQGFTGELLFVSIGNTLIVSILYFIFVAGIYVILNLNKGYIYSKEESVAMLLVVIFALAATSQWTLFGFSIFNILVLTVILIYGWKNGAISGCAAGMLAGLFLSLITHQISMNYIVAMAFSGAIAGIFKRLGKPFVVIAFVLGNVYLAYYSNGFSELNIPVAELLIASISLLFMPKQLELKLTNLFNKNKTLNKPYENMLDVASHLKNKIGAVSDIFEDLSYITIEETQESTQETKNMIKKYIQDYVENVCIDCQDKHACLEEERLNMTVDYLVNKLENKEVITKSMFIFECDHAEKLAENITEVYHGIKLMRILKEKEKENSIKISNQYKEVSKILSNMANNIKNMPAVKDKNQEKLRDELKFYGFVIYEDEYITEGQNIEYTFVTDILTNIDKQKKQIIHIANGILEQNMSIKLILNSSKKEKSKIKLVSIPAYEIKTSISSSIKEGESISGDSYLSLELEDLKHINVISDGAGSGKQASKNSMMVISMLEKLISSGFNERKAIDMINAILKLKEQEGAFSTLDAVIINLKTADAEFIKVGSAPTYIVEDGKVTTINNMTVPIGLLKEAQYIPIAKKLSVNSFVIQVSDGVIKEGMDIQNNYLTEYLKTIESTKLPRVISDEIQRLVMKQNENQLKDDVTILVTKIKSTNQSK